MTRTRTPRHRGFSTTPRPEPAPQTREFEPSDELAQALQTIRAGGPQAIRYALARFNHPRDAAALERLQAEARKRSQDAFDAVLDQPDARGGVRPDREGGYDRIDENEDPFKLSGATERRRRAAAREQAAATITADGMIEYIDSPSPGELARQVARLEGSWRGGR
jgi:hypothetical protein